MEMSRTVEMTNLRLRYLFTERVRTGRKAAVAEGNTRPRWSHACEHTCVREGM